MTGAPPPTVFRYHGKSMWPCFQEGDLLAVEAVDPNRVQVGDCVLWSEETGRWVVHRVVGLRGGLCTRGDAMAQHDCHGNQAPMISGRVIRRYRSGRWTRIAGGGVGRWTGVFYRYAGRIDPQRNARGGKLAKLIRALAWPVLKSLVSRRELRPEDCPAKEMTVVWRFAGQIVATHSPGGELPWPWRLILRPEPGRDR